MKIYYILEFKRALKLVTGVYNIRANNAEDALAHALARRVFTDSILFTVPKGSREFFVCNAGEWFKLYADAPYFVDHPEDVPVNVFCHQELNPLKDHELILDGAAAYLQ